MDKIKTLWKGLTKRGKTLAIGLSAIAVLIILNYIF